MKVSEILNEVATTRGSIAKKEILLAHHGNELLKRALEMGLNTFTPFHVVKVPKVKEGERRCAILEKDRWNMFFDCASICASRSHTGNAAIELMHTALSSADELEEKWMRKILQKKLSIGASTKTINKIWPGLIPTFEVSLAQKFELKRIKDEMQVYVEPKLDGIRCFAIVENYEAKLYARSGKLITNFDDTIGSALVSLGDGCYDGELMGEDFVALMRQAYRKDNVDPEGTYLALFDYLPIHEWKENQTVSTTQERFTELHARVAKSKMPDYVRVVQRYTVDAKYDEIMSLHNTFIKSGYEGAMVKTINSPYRFGRSYDIMKVKEFHDVDLPIIGWEEGTGRHEGKLGAVKVDYKGVIVKIGSGFSDEERELVWNDKDNFLGRMIEIRYQEVTPDGSLRFPTFVCFRNDRE